MSRLASYIVIGVLRGTALVAVALVAVASVIEFAGQLDDVGIASYGLRDALLFVALRIPHTLFRVLPAAALIGSLLALGNMAVHRELVVMRASGVSQYRLLGAVAAAGLVLFVVMLLLGESVAPKLGAYARTARAEALLEDVDTAAARSTFLEDGDRIIKIWRPPDAEGPGQTVRVFDLEGDTGLRAIAEGELILPSDSDVWDIFDYAATEFGETGVTARQSRYIQQDYGFSREILELSEMRADLLELPELGRLIGDLEGRGLDASRYLAAYWGRIASAVSVVLMAMLALPFVLGSLRSAGAGARMIVGLVIGLAYYTFGELSANTGEVFALDPVVAAWAPSGVLFVVTALAVVSLR